MKIETIVDLAHARRAGNRDPVLGFGKFSGHALSEVRSLSPSYWQWLMGEERAALRRLKLEEQNEGH